MFARTTLVTFQFVLVHIHIRVLGPTVKLLRIAGCVCNIFFYHKLYIPAVLTYRSSTTVYANSIILCASLLRAMLRDKCLIQLFNISIKLVCQKCGSIHTRHVVLLQGLSSIYLGHLSLVSRLLFSFLELIRIIVIVGSLFVLFDFWAANFQNCISWLDFLR